MSLEINSITDAKLKAAAQLADERGNKDGKVDSNEVTIFASQARKNGCEDELIFAYKTLAQQEDTVEAPVSQTSSSETAETTQPAASSSEYTIDDTAVTAESIKEEKAEGNRQEGKGLYSMIAGGGTSARQHAHANEELEKLNKDNIMDFMDGYYSKKGGLTEYGFWNNQREGLLEHLDDECDGGIVTLKNKINVVTSLLKRAKELGLDKNSAAYDKLASTLYKYGNFNEETCEVDDLDESRGDLHHFNSQYWGLTASGTVAGAAAGAVAGAAIGSVVPVVGTLIGGVVGGIAGGLIGLFGSRRKDSETMDDCMKQLYQEIREKEGKEPEGASANGALRTAGTVAAGAVAGAAIGSVIPGVGTLIGAGVGAAVGLISKLFW